MVAVIIGLPVFVMTTYNVYRQEINPAAPPLIDVLPDWHWGVWLSILLLVCVVILILEIYRRSSDNSNKASYHQSPYTRGDHIGDVVFGDKVIRAEAKAKPSEPRVDVTESKKDYKVAVALTESNEDGIELACIQVIANENIYCVAKIDSIVKLNKRGSPQKKEEKNLVNKLNPRGAFLLWLNNLRDYADLKKDIPDSITTVTAHKNIVRLGFRWEGSDSHRLDGARYEIGVRIYRREEGLIDMSLVKGILRIKTEKGVYGGVTKKLHWEQESGKPETRKVE